jgi:hypothetical protein
MSELAQRKHDRGLSIILAIFTLVYPLGAVYLLLSWFGAQSFNPMLWQRNSLLIYALIFLIGTVSLYGIWKWKKWGVYSLAGTWVFTGAMNFVFAPTTLISVRHTFLAVLLVIAFFLFLRPAWRNME